MFGRKRRISDKRFAKLLAELADFEEAEASIAAAEAISSLDDRTRLPELYRILKETDDFCVRESVGTAICRMDGLSALRELLAAMRLDGHDYDGLNCELDHLIASQPEVSAPLLLDMLEHGTATERIDAARKLDRVAKFIEPDPLLMAFQSDDRELRAAALSALVGFDGRPELFAMFQRLAAQDPDEQTRRTSIAGVLYSGHPAAAATIEAALSDPAEYVRSYAEYAHKLLLRERK